MLRKIDKLQADVDDLLDLCAEAGGEFEPTGRRTIRQQRLYVMGLKMQDGNLCSRHIHRFGKWLSCDRQALADYVEFQQLTVLLYEYYNPGRFRKFLNFMKSCLTV